MTDGRWGGLLHQLRRTALLHDGAGLSDGQLLEAFLARRDETAFEALVRRHGPMVLGVCRRLLPNLQDAEDAFQAAFLVLVRKAASIRPRDLVGNWLYGVAYRTALEARSVLARRRTREKQVSALPEPTAPQPEFAPDLRPLLDQELSRLPDKYRVPVVLCDLEGRSRKEVAKALRLPEGTLSSRLATARRLLAQRLSRYGLGVSAAGLAVILTQQAAAMPVPASLLAATTHAATLFAAGTTAAAGAISSHVVLLTNGVLKTMFLTKLKTVTAVFALMAVLGGGIGLLGSDPQAAPTAQKKQGQAKQADTKKSREPVKLEIVQNREVEKKLNEVTAIKFQDQPLREILDQMRDSAGLNIVVDKQSLSNAGVDLNVPISIQLEGVTRKTALKYILRDAGLAFKVEDGLLVVTAGGADNNQKTRRVYPVADLIGEQGDAEDLIRVIRSTVGGPRYWAPRALPQPGGQLVGPVVDDSGNPEGGAVEYFAEGKSLVIHQTRELQEQIQELLEELRSSKKQQEK